MSHGMRHDAMEQRTFVEVIGFIKLRAVHACACMNALQGQDCLFVTCLHQDFKEICLSGATVGAPKHLGCRHQKAAM